jgi:hypothetical protein
MEQRWRFVPIAAMTDYQEQPRCGSTVCKNGKQ